MKKKSLYIPLTPIILCIITSFHIFQTTAFSQEPPYPEKVQLITRDQAHYKTPENTLSADLSSFFYKDLEWYYEVLTQEAANSIQQAFEGSGMDPYKIFEMGGPTDQTYILEKFNYKNGVILVVQVVSSDGSMLIIPSGYIKENDLWKQTNEFNKDEALDAFTKVVEPDAVLAAVVRLHPVHWNYNWIHRIENHNRTSKIQRGKFGPALLCVLGTIEDTEGVTRSVTEIDPETLLLNYVVRPIPWRHDKEKQVGMILKNGQNTIPKHKGFALWKHKHQPFADYKGPVMLMRFNILDAMETLDDLEFGKGYIIPITGKLKDGTHFKGEANITITSPQVSKKPDEKSEKMHDSSTEFKNWWDFDH